VTESLELPALWPAVLEGLEGVGIGVVIIADRNGVQERLYTSRCAAALLGVSPEQASELPPYGGVDDDERRRFEAMRDRRRSGLEVPRSFETVLKRPDGGRTPVEVHVIRIAITDGSLAITFLTDISERSAAHGHALEAERLAIVGAIAAGVAHEINNPLTYVLLHLRSLRKALPRWNLEPAAAADVTRLLDEAEGGAARVKVIVRDLLTLARGPTEGAVVGDGVEVAKVIDGAVRLLAPSMQHRLRIARDGVAAATVVGDETRLCHAVLAMLLFAGGGFDHDDPSTHLITISVTVDGGDVHLDVADNGADIAPDQLARAFEPFYLPRGGGPGASLAFVRAIASGLGGAATLSRRDGGGALIRMTLPVQT
jgi:PAS domain S-box-containing protein